MNFPQPFADNPLLKLQIIVLFCATHKLKLRLNRTRRSIFICAFNLRRTIFIFFGACQP